MPRIARLAATLLLLVTTGCTATPDISAWSTASTSLAGAVNAENRSVIERVDSLIGQINVAKQAGWNIDPNALTTWQTTRSSWSTSNANVEAAMAAMVAYSQALANLAAAGETGKEAIGKMATSVKNIGTTLGLSFAPATAVVNAVTFIADQWNRAQAQESLAAAMKQTQPDVVRLTNLLIIASNTQKGFIRDVASLERQLAALEAGTRLMSAYKREHKDMRKAILAGPPSEKTTAMLALLNHMESRLNQREAKKTSATAWSRARSTALAKIVEAGKVWRDTHARAATLLETCGGFRGLEPKCGNLTADNLKVIASHIQALLNVGEQRTDSL